MKENFHVRSARHCTIFLAVHLALALLSLLAAPAAFEDIPAPLAWWGRILQAIVPSIQAISQFSTFESQAWLMLVAMWTFLPLSAWWVARGDWVFDPDSTAMRRRPWILLAFAVLFVLLVVFMAVYEPLALEEVVTRKGRAMAHAARSPIEFGFLMGFLFSGLGIAAGCLPKMFRVFRQAISDDTR